MFKHKVKANKVGSYAFLLLISSFTLTLILWAFLASISQTKDIFKGNVLSFNYSFDSYVKLLDSGGGLENIINTVIYSVATCVLVIFLTAPLAYALARFDFKGRDTMKQMLAFLLNVPSIIVTIPIFTFTSALEMTNSRLVIIVIYTVLRIPFNTFFLISFFQNIPKSYEESAMLDGAGYYRIFWSIIFPFARSAIFTLTIINFISTWNEYFIALIFANSRELRPVGVWLNAIIASMKVNGNWSGMFAAIIIVSIPTIVIYSILSEKIINNNVSGGVKG